MESSIPQYVIDLISKIAEQEKFEKYSISTEAGSNADGFQSLILKIAISGCRNNRDDKLSCICKIPSMNIVRRKQFHSDVTFDPELFFYENVFPYFETFQRDRGVHTGDGFFAFPKCYGLIRDDKPLGDHAIVMDNLNERSYYMLDKANDIDFDHSVLVLKELGKLHAVSFAIRDQDPEKFKQFMQRTSTFHQEIIRSTAGGQLLQKSHFDRAIRSLDSSETDLINKMESLKLTFTDMLNQVKSNTTCEPFGVLVHGDCWINNLLYLDDNVTGTPSNVCLIDWQLSQFGSPAIDVACFLFCSLSPQLRNEHFDQFMNIYYGSLESTLRKLGSEPSELFTFENLQDQMRQFSKYVLFLAPIMIGIMTSDMSKIPGMDEITRRMDVLTNDPTADVTLDDAFEENDEYKYRMGNLIRDVDRLGYW